MIGFYPMGCATAQTTIAKPGTHYGPSVNALVAFEQSSASLPKCSTFEMGSLILPSTGLYLLLILLIPFTKIFALYFIVGMRISIALPRITNLTRMRDCPRLFMRTIFFGLLSLRSMDCLLIFLGVCFSPLAQSFSHTLAARIRKSIALGAVLIKFIQGLVYIARRTVLCDRIGAHQNLFSGVMPAGVSAPRGLSYCLNYSTSFRITQPFSASGGSKWLP